MDIKEFKKQPLLGILRGVTPDILEPLVGTIQASGVRTIEITMNTPEAGNLIKKAKAIVKGSLVIGAGTVLTLDELKQALDAGATFIVTPVLVKDVTEYCVKNKIPVFPGALTPAEIYAAWNAGAAMVKVFPAKFFGPEYFREVKAPFHNIELLACAGVTPENLKSYLKNGANAVSFGASVFRPEWLAKKDFKSIGKSIGLFIDALK